MMALYRHILLVVDLTDDSLAIAAQGSRARRRRWERSSNCCTWSSSCRWSRWAKRCCPSVQMEEELVERAEQRLQALAAELGLDRAACRVESGNVKSEIVRVARERKADLIVLGSRERHGLSILVNLTEDTVLHAAPCDVLAMRATRS